MKNIFLLTILSVAAVGCTAVTPTMRKGVSYTISLTLDKTETKSNLTQCHVSGISITENPEW